MLRPLLACLSLLLHVTLAFSAPSTPPPPQLVTFLLSGTGEPTDSLRFKATPEAPPNIFPLVDESVAGPYLPPKSETVVLQLMETPEQALARWRKANPGKPDPATPPLPVPREAGRINVPDSSNVVVLVLFSGNSVSQLRAYDQSEKTVPSGRILFTNLCKTDVALQMGPSQVVIPPVGNQLVPLVTPNGRPRSVRLSLAWKRQGNWEVLEDMKRIIDPSKRQLGFIQPDGPGARLFLLPPAPPDPKEPEAPAKVAAR